MWVAVHPRTRPAMSSRDGADLRNGQGQAQRRARSHGDLLDRMYAVALHLTGDRHHAERAVERAYASTEPGYESDKRRIALYRALIASLRDDGHAGPERRTGAPVVDAVHALPETYRAPVLLADVEGFSARELATVFDLPAGELRDTVARAHLRLYDTLSAAGGGRRFRPVARDGDQTADGSSRPPRPAARDEDRGER